MGGLSNFLFYITLTFFLNSKECYGKIFDEKINEIICNYDGKIYYFSSDLPRIIKKYLTETASHRIKFSSIKTHYKKRKNNHVIYFILNLKHDWIIYYAHATRGLHRHLVYIKLSEKGKVCIFKNQYYLGTDVDFASLKNKACSGTLVLSDIINNTDL